MYKFCFHNPYSTPETVSFHIHVGHIPNEHDLAKDGNWLTYINVTLSVFPGLGCYDNSTRFWSLTLLWLFLAEHLDPINVKIAELREALESVTAEQKYLKARDTRHRHSMWFILVHGFCFLKFVYLCRFMEFLLANVISTLWLKMEIFLLRQLNITIMDTIRSRCLCMGILTYDRLIMHVGSNVQTTNWIY